MSLVLVSGCYLKSKINLNKEKRVKMTTKKLTEKQKNILNIIEMYINDYGYSPTIRELCNLADLKSTSTIQGYLDNLERNGYITKMNGGSRTIRVKNREDQK